MTWSIAVEDVRDWQGEGLYHAMLCDPPYELGFMGKHWDASGIAFQPETWAHLMQFLHPGAFCMAFAGCRTYHRIACAIEDAGYILHPMLAWVFSSGFPKATNISKQLDDILGNQSHGFNSAGGKENYDKQNLSYRSDYGYQYQPQSELAATWAGHRYGRQALKPMVEPVIVFQVPYEGRPADCITRTGAGGLWIDEGRIATNGEIPSGSGNPALYDFDKASIMPGRSGGNGGNITPSRGRWPGNLALCHLSSCARIGEKRVRNGGSIRSSEKGSSASFTSHGFISNIHYFDADGLETVETWECAEGCPVAALNAQAGERKSGARSAKQYGHYSASAYEFGGRHEDADASSGPASRFFFNADYALERLEALEFPGMYCPKASRSERDRGLEGRELQQRPGVFDDDGYQWDETKGHRIAKPCLNHHPTVKPLSLIRWLATLLLPPAEYAPRRILVPFGGVCSEALGAMLAGWEEIAVIEKEAEYAEIGESRMRWWSAKMQETGSSDPGAILKVCGRMGKEKRDLLAHSPCESSDETREGEQYGVQPEPYQPPLL